MKVSIPLLCGLGLLPTTRRNVTSTQVQLELGGKVSNTTVIYGPQDHRYAEATARWSSFAMPHVQVVVEPTQESDVSTIVEYCNENNIDFLAINRGHGHSASLGTFNGIQINVGKLDNIDIQPGGNSVWFGGGVFGGLVSKTLWENDYVATT
ncbi:hypothetical protein INS49_013547 [Diaporthe citri]|uniref:uncharacterized protein n=1 Tax=Diaporthe citri TaxID=83186 RepID=UPI001C80D614|nr:uncharacterized protein INS49_013547 [Diaporthe citri]KAG6357668.1 hypothetical protein INS49_013547 [Diaporthe citri]